MPIYCYECEKCETEFEKYLKVKDYDIEILCPKCGCIARKVVSIVSKGYILGYNAKNGYSKKQKTAM